MLLLEGISNFYKLKLLFLDQLDNWAEKHLAEGAKQSPIPIDDDNVVAKQLPPLRFHNYDKMVIPIVNNTGNGISVTILTDPENPGDESDAIPSITGGPLEDEYLLKEIQFRWESEHSINGRKFPLEGHFIHYRKDCSNFEEALEIEQGLCIVGALYEVSKCENPNFEVISEAVEQICDEVGTPLTCGNEVCCKDLLPKYTSSFYSYEGSLTTGDFKENVMWIILGEPGRIERRQLKSLTGIMNANYEDVKSNYRDIQKVNDREITYTSSLFSRVRKTFRKLWGS